MKHHDAYLRRTPAELLFSDVAEAQETIAGLSAEASELGIDPTDPLALAQVPGVGRVLASVRPEGEDPHAAHAYSSLLYFSVHSLSLPEPALLVDESLARRATGDDPLGWQDWDGNPPQPAGYLQLPRNLFWLSPANDRPAEAVDGLYWVHSGGALWVMIAAGLLPGRPGFSAVMLDRLPAGDAPAWYRAAMREESVEFSSTLPGGELSGFYSLDSAGEALKLLVRLWTVAHWADPAVASASSGEVEGTDPPPSALAYRRFSSD